jgi:hypothetical protein
VLTLPAALTTELATAGHADLARLVEIHLDTVVYRTDWGKQITFTPDGDSAAHTYIPDDFSFGAIRATAMQESPSFDLRIQNRRNASTDATRPWSTELASTDMNGTKVNVRLVMVSQVADGTAQIAEERWYISGPRLEGDYAIFPLGPKHQIFRLETPGPRLASPRCFYEYKDGNCASQSTLKTCPGKTLFECQQRHSPWSLRFSQLPFIDGSLTRRG